MAHPPVQLRLQFPGVPSVTRLLLLNPGPLPTSNATATVLFATEPVTLVETMMGLPVLLVWTTPTALLAVSSIQVWPSPKARLNWIACVAVVVAPTESAAA